MEIFGHLSSLGPNHNIVELKPILHDCFIVVLFSLGLAPVTSCLTQKLSSVYFYVASVAMFLCYRSKINAILQERQPGVRDLHFAEQIIF